MGESLLYWGRLPAKLPENCGSGKTDRKGFMRASLNSSWTVEQLFQEARMKGPRLVVALLLMPTTGFEQPASTDQFARGDRLITSHQQAAANPAPEFSIARRVD